MTARPADIRAANAIAARIAETGATRTPWKRVATLRHQFAMEGAIFSASQRERMQTALELAGLAPDPPITEVDRNDTVKLRPRSAVATDASQGRPLGATSTSSSRSDWTGRRIFISYRREDCQPQANGLNDGLRQRVEGADVFMDVDTIPPGTDFEEFIRNWIENADVVLVLVGDNWLDRDSDGERRIDHPEDFVRLEVRAALEQGKKIIPVLVEGAEMPRSTELPEDISRLARIQSFELADGRWISDIERLADVIRTASTGSSLRVEAPPLAMSGFGGSAAAPDPFGQEEAAASIDFPLRFTDRWFRTHVPDMNRRELRALQDELENRGWWHGEMIDSVWIYADEEHAPPPRQVSDSPESAAPFTIPSRVHPAWLAKTVPALDEDQVAALVKVLRERGWTEGQIEDHVFGYWSERDGSASRVDAARFSVSDVRQLAPTSTSADPPLSRSKSRPVDRGAARAFIESIPPGFWASYGDVATAAGSPQGGMAVGQWLLREGEEIKNVWRVLKSSGAVSDGWAPKDPRLPHDPQEVRALLRSEGLGFDRNDRADPAKRWPPSKADSPTV